MYRDLVARILGGRAMDVKDYEAEKALAYEAGYNVGSDDGYKKANADYLRGYSAVYDDETRRLARDLLLVYAQAGFEPRKEDVQNIVRAARWLMEEWRNPTPDPPPPRLDEQ